mgnify:CR=1 FL=1
MQLGLGSAALTKFCYRRLPQAQVTAIELNPNVIEMCRAQFALPSNDERLQVREMNALDFVLDPANHVPRETYFSGILRPYIEIMWQDYRIWGATASMLINLRTRLGASS